MTLRRADVRRARRLDAFRIRMAHARDVRTRARIVGDYIAAEVNDRALTPDQACARLDELVPDVLALIRDPEEQPHDHS